MKLRAVFYIGLLASFAMLAPYLLLRATGHRIDLANRKIVSTGAIAVTVFPTDAKVTLVRSDKKLEQSKRPGQLNPTILKTDVLPGTYRVRVEAPGRVPWEKTVPVEENKTSSYPFVRLLPVNALASGTFSRAPLGLLTDEEANVLVGWDAQGLFGSALGGAHEKLASLERVLAGDIQSAQWLARTKALFVQFRNGTSLLYFGIRDGEQPVISPLPQNVGKFAEEKDHILIAQTGTTLLRIDADATPPVIARLAENVAAFASRGERIAYLDTKGTLWVLDGDSPLRQRTVVPFEGNAAHAELVLGNDGETLLLRDDDNSAWLLERDADRFTHVADGVRTMSISPDGTKALLEGTHEISFIALKERTDQPKREKGARETIARFTDAIKDAAFLPPEYEHVAVLSGSTLHIIELDGRGGRNEARYEHVAAFTFAAHPARLLTVSQDNIVGMLDVPLPGLLDRLGPQTPR